MYCMNCGAKIDDSAVFCPHCGTSTATPYPTESSTAKNEIAIVGFILAFFTFFPALICSIVGLSRANSMNGNGKGFAIAGIIIPILKLVFTILLFSSILALIMLGEGAM